MESWVSTCIRNAFTILANLAINFTAILCCLKIVSKANNLLGCKLMRHLRVCVIINCILKFLTIYNMFIFLTEEKRKRRKLKLRERIARYK